MQTLSAELKNAITDNVKHALAEDLNGQSASEGDITALLIPSEQAVKAQILTREDCVLAGIPWLLETFAQVDDHIQVELHAQDGDKLIANQVFCSLYGNARALLTGERTALNFVQTLSATATQTHNYQQYLQGSTTKLLDTRKTLPGMRLAQKYAVLCGGGHNHRVGLYDAFLIKENHILACGSIHAAVTQAKQLKPTLKVEVEVENLDELQQAIDAGADIVMLDNFSTQDIYTAVQQAKDKCQLEVSGNITAERLTELAQTGVDFISSGALTKHIQAIDLSFRVIE